ncbi:MAG: pirin family protein [Erysipelotrichales bacterium]
MERKIKRIVEGKPAVDGAGVHLNRVLGINTLKDFDPFLMLDSFDSTNPNDYIKGFPWHPHRGIETVTYLVSGSMEHEDSLGNKGTIKPHQSQWMSAGSGIMHQEMPQASDRMLGFQLWINMAADKKMDPPAYNDLSSDNYIKTIVCDDCVVNLISGQYEGESAFSPSFVKATILDIDLKANKEFIYEINKYETAFVFLIEGEALIDNQDIKEKSAVLLEGGDVIKVKTKDKPLRFALLHALPLNETVAWGGPIVMNYKEELDLAFEQLDKGTFIK